MLIAIDVASPNVVIDNWAVSKHLVFITVDDR